MDTNTSVIRLLTLIGRVQARQDADVQRLEKDETICGHCGDQLILTVAAMAMLRGLQAIAVTDQGLAGEVAQKVLGVAARFPEAFHEPVAES